MSLTEQNPSCFSGIEILPPTVNEVTICEKGCQYLTEPADRLNKNGYVTQLSHYKRIEATNELDKCRIVSSVKSAFIEQQSNYWQKITSAWKSYGISGVVRELSSIEDSIEDNQKNSWSFRLQVVTKNVLTWMLNMQQRFLPVLTVLNRDVISYYTCRDDRKDTSVVAFAWHPHISKFAIAFKDNTIRIMSLTSDKYNVLKHGQQEGVACLAWRPFSGHTLAVGGIYGIVIWSLNADRNIASRQSVQVLERKGHVPVTTLDWSPNGKYLASGSPLDTALLIWDVDIERNIPLRRSGGNPLVRWSPDGSKLFSASSEAIFRVWDTRSWTCEKWSRLKSRCRSVSWSPDGKILLFSLMKDSSLYFLYFKDGTLGSSGEVAINLTNLQSFQFANGVKVGGSIDSISWDDTGTRLSVTFTGNENEDDKNNEIIAIFLTTLQPNFRVSPCGFIRGEENEVACIVNFHNSTINKKLLSVYWSSGYISFIPFYMDDARSRKTGISSSLTNQRSILNTTDLYYNDT